MLGLSVLNMGVSFAGFVLPVKARVPHGRPSLFHGLLHAKHLFLARVRTIAGGELKPWADFSLVGKPMVFPWRPKGVTVR